MKLEQIRKNAELVAGINKLMSDPHFDVLLEMLDDENPGKMDLGFGVPVFDIARLHDRRTGYELAVANLKRASEFNPPAKTVPQDYPQ